MKEYFDEIEKEVKRSYGIAEKARQSGLDPEQKVDIPIARNLAERVVGLIRAVAPQILESNIVERIESLEKKYGKLDWRVALSIALEVAQEKICKFNNKKEAMEVGIRIALAYLTLGVVASPLEGFTELKIKKRRDGKEYFCLMFSGPIRSAGTTVTFGSVIAADYVRKNMGYEKYDASENEIKRMVTELYDYHERVSNLQYLPSEEEIKFMIKNLPVQIDGEPSEKYEVSNYKDLDRIETNRIRNGPCLVIGEALCQKAAKAWKQITNLKKEFEIEDWDFIEKFLKLQKKIKAKGKEESKEGESKEGISADFTYIKDLVAGRPVLTHPLRQGGFRLRYGRSRTSGLSSMSMHPATMAVLNNFIATGTQLRYERPGKSSAMAPCDSIEGPIVKLKDGSVLFLEKAEEARKVANEVEEILYLGDFLVNYGEFFNRAHKLVPAGYCEEWYSAELEKNIEKKELEKLGADEKLIEKIKLIIKEPRTEIGAEEAIKISKILKMSLHPRYTFHWKAINKEGLLSLVNWIKRGKTEENKIILPLEYSVKEDVEGEDPKRVLELLGVPHKVVSKENVVVEGDWAAALKESLENLNLDKESVLESLNPELNIKDKDGTFIGARMGRPEKAKMRKLTGSPQVLFPVGTEGGRLRCFQSALEKGKIKSQFPNYFCEECNKETVYGVCENCGKKAKKKYYCKECKILVENKKCEKHGDAESYKIKSIEVKDYFNAALNKLKLKEYPELIKGVRGTSNKEHIPENLAKGILRARNSLYVNKDGTIRFDMTEMPVTHFKAKEIGTSIKKLNDLGYEKDIYGKELKDEEQLVEIKPQDVILPACDCALEEGADKVLVRVAKFVDELLEKFYGLEKFYDIKKREELAGHLVIGLAPHTSAAIVGRIIGFSNTQGCYAHPLWHSAQRRDCVFGKTKFVYYDLNKKEIFYEEIGELVEGLIKNGAKTKKIDQVGTVSVENKKNILAIGINPDNRKLVFKRIKYFIKGPVTKKWVKLTTATNREIMMTPTHNFMHLDENNEFIFKEAKEAMVDDKVPVLSKFELDFDFKDKINLVELFIEHLHERDKKNIRFVNCEERFRKIFSENRKRIIEILNLRNSSFKHNFTKWPRHASLSDFEKLMNAGLIDYNDLAENTYINYFYSDHKLPMFLNISKELVNLLGYYTAEGYSRSNKSVSQVSFRTFNKELQERLIWLIKSVFGIKANTGEENSKITICSKLVYLLFTKCFKTGSGAYSKRVPNFIFSLPKELVLEYISGYLDGDGSVINQRNAIVFYSVNRSLLDDVALLASRFGLISRYQKTKERGPGRKVLMIYKKLGKEPKKHILNHLVFSGVDAYKLKSILKLNNLIKANKLNLIKEASERRINYNGKQLLLKFASDYFVDYVKNVEFVNDEGNSYCVEIDWKSKEDRNILWGEQIINTRCEGDENCIILLMDALLNFSRQFLPAHRGATQDAPLVLTSRLEASEVDDMVFDMDVVWRYPLELYEAALLYKEPWEVKIEQLSNRLGSEKELYDYGFTHDVSNMNMGIGCSAYKSIPSMEGKVKGQMEIAEKIRAVDEADVARLVIERHFMRDIKGNLRKFSMQEFRCVKCNEKYRRPPLKGECLKCGGRIIFTIAHGSVIKYLEPSIQLAEKYALPAYLKQTLELTKQRIESVFGKEDEKQEGLGKWF